MKPAFLLLFHCLLLFVIVLKPKAECRTNVSFVDAIQFGDGPLAEPSARFPYIAYILEAKYANFFNQTKSEVITDECVGQPFLIQVNGSHNGTISKSSVSGGGGVPDFRFRSFGSLSKKDAEENLPSLGAGGKFRFRDLLHINTTRTDPIRIAVTISMDGNISQPLNAIPVPQQLGHTLVRVNITDVTFCQGPSSQFVNLSRNSDTVGSPDYHTTYIFDACPTAIVRIDVMVQLNATASRFTSIGNQTFIGGYAFTDYTQCVNGNSVCWEDCEGDDLQNCSGFSIRAHVVDPPAPDSKKGQAAPVLPPVQLVSAAGLDYAAPLKTFQPGLQVRNDQTNAVVQWPSTANDWTISRSSDLTAWSPITNKPAFDPDQMLFQILWPLTNAQQFFRLEKPLAAGP